MYLGIGAGSSGAEALQIFGATILVSGSDPIILWTCSHSVYLLLLPSKPTVFYTATVHSVPV